MSIVSSFFKFKKVYQFFSDLENIDNVIDSTSVLTASTALFFTGSQFDLN